MKHTSIRALITALALSFVALQPAQAQEPLRLRAYAIQTGQVPGDRASVVDLNITRWSTLIEIRIDEDGRGEGRMSVATRVELSPDGKHLQLEDYSAQPVLLKSVRRVED